MTLGSRPRTTSSEAKRTSADQEPTITVPGREASGMIRKPVTCSDLLGLPVGTGDEMIKRFSVLTNLLCQNAQAEAGPNSLARTVCAFDPQISNHVLQHEVGLIKGGCAQRDALE